MANKIQIFVEGKTDKKFLSDYLMHLEVVTTISNNLFFDCKGKDNLLSGNLNETLIAANKEYDKICVIFDADLFPKKRFEELERIKKDTNVEFDIFLFPNNTHTSEIEDLLFNIINKQHQSVLDCFEKYNNCLDDKYNKPNKEAKVYACLESILPKNRSQEIKLESRNYRDTEIWNLNSDYLYPLKEFLLKLK